MTRILDVVIDDREPQEFAALFTRGGADHVSVRRLPVGDFVVNNRWVFERKTLPDLCQSLVDGRLFRQAERMANASAYPVLILQGGAYDLEQNHVTRAAIQGALITISVFFHIPILRALDMAEVVRLIQYTVVQDGRFCRNVVHRGGTRPKRKTARQLYVLQGLPGIGRCKAIRLLERFGSIQNVMNASAEALAEVEGIGEKSARCIRDLIATT